MHCVGVSRERQDRERIAQAKRALIQDKVPPGENILYARACGGFRKFDSRVLPALTERREPNPRRQARREHDDPLSPMLASEGYTGLGVLATREQSGVTAVPEKLGMVATEAQKPVSQKHFD